MNDQLKVSDTKDRIFNRVISDIFVVLRETTLTISYFIETVSPVQSEILRVVTLSRLPRKSKPDPQGSDTFSPFPNKPWFLRVCSTSLLKTLWEKEKC